MEMERQQMKVIIAGGRDFTNAELFLTSMDSIEWDITEVVVGGAPGADTMGHQWAVITQHPFKLFAANWRDEGRAAGPIRNKKMGDYADALIAFWNGKSRGTKNMIDYMMKLNKPVKVIIYKAIT